MAVVVRLALTFRENLQLLEGTRRQALTDALTGLANRRKLMDDLTAAAASATERHPHGLLLFDLDGFKQYNDRYGHPVGDALLSRLGRRLDAAVRPTGRAYRLGGDEFAVIAEGSRAALAQLAARAREALTERGKGFEVSSSCGVVELPTEAADVTHALHVADERLYEEKGIRRRSTLSQETSDALLQVLKEREPALRDHLSEVAQLALGLGERLGLRKEQLDELARAAELHDIGKIAVPEEILTKAGPLDEREWEFVRQHTLVGDRILSAAPTLTARGQARPGEPRELRRLGLSGRALTRGDPAGRPHRLGLRRLPRHDLRSPLPARDGQRGGDRGAAALRRPAVRPRGRGGVLRPARTGVSTWRVRSQKAHKRC